MTRSPHHAPTPWWKLAIAILAVLLLSAPSAVGVARALEPTRGLIPAVAAAIGFELAYLSLALLTLRPALRSHAGSVAGGAVLTAIALNTLADYAHRVPGGLDSWVAARRLFDPLALALSFGESVPLAGLAFALASLLHRLAETPAAPAAPAEERSEGSGALLWPRTQEIYPTPGLAHEESVAPTDEDCLLSAGNTDVLVTGEAVAIYDCRHCGATGLTKSEQLAHGRRHARERRLAEAGGDA